MPRSTVESTVSGTDVTARVDTDDAGFADDIGKLSDVSQDAGTAREERIRRAAYAAAERRGFIGGSEVDDWLDAERQVDADDSAGKPGAGTTR